MKIGKNMKLILSVIVLMLNSSLGAIQKEYFSKNKQYKCEIISPHTEARQIEYFKQGLFAYFQEDGEPFSFEKILPRISLYKWSKEGKWQHFFTRPLLGYPENVFVSDNGLICLISNYFPFLKDGVGSLVFYEATGIPMAIFAIGDIIEPHQLDFYRSVATGHGGLVQTLVFGELRFSKDDGDPFSGVAHDGEVAWLKINLSEVVEDDIENVELEFLLFLRKGMVVAYDD